MTTCNKVISHSIGYSLFVMFSNALHKCYVYQQDGNLVPVVSQMADTKSYLLVAPNHSCEIASKFASNKGVLNQGFNRYKNSHTICQNTIPSQQYFKSYLRSTSDWTDHVDGHSKAKANKYTLLAGKTLVCKCVGVKATMPSYLFWDHTKMQSSKQLKIQST